MASVGHTASSSIHVSATSTMMQVEVEGEDITPDQVTEANGWSISAAQKARFQDPGMLLPGGARLHPKPNGVTHPGRARDKVIKNARMPALPRDDFKIVLRPRGGINISKIGHADISEAVNEASGIPRDARTRDVICPNYQQNIIIASTSSRENAGRYARINKITVGGRVHEVSAYETAPHGMVKGVIRDIPLHHTPQDINERIVNEFNPTAVEAKRISNTRSVVIAFYSNKVPNYVRYGNGLAKCTLYRKQIDVCYHCGRVGHRMDVCPNPNDRVCRGCGAKNPPEVHTCEPKCNLCGGEHPTGEKTCRARYKIPYVVRRRQWERKHANEEDGRNPGRSASRERPPGSRRRSLSRGGERRRSSTPGPSTRTSTPGAPAAGRDDGAGRRSRSKTRSDASVKGGVTWADKAKLGELRKKQGPTTTTSNGNPQGLPSNDENYALRQENALMRANMQKLTAENASMMAAIQKLTAEIEALRRETRSAPTSAPASPIEQPTPAVEEDEDIADDVQHNNTPAPKKRAVSESSFKFQTREAIKELRASNQEVKTEVSGIKAEIQGIKVEMQGIKETLRNIQEFITKHPIFVQYSQAQEMQSSPPQPTWPPTKLN